MIKCLLSCATSHHVIYLKATASTDHLTFDQFRLDLISHYGNLINELNLDFKVDSFEIYDTDFDQYVIMDRCSRIRHLSKLKVIKASDQCRNECPNCGTNRNAFKEESSMDSSQRTVSGLNQNSIDTSRKASNGLNSTSQTGSLNDHELNQSQPPLNRAPLADRTRSADLIAGLSSNLHRNLPVDFNKANDQTPILNTSFKTYQTVECQTDEIERRVVHLKDNPFKQRCLQMKNDYGRLIEDNKRLNAKLELYKQGSVANATNYLEDFVCNADQIERLKSELDEAKDEQKTIMEAFKKKSKEFRRVVYLLTGFKFDALEQRKYRVSHIYSNPNDYLFFTFEKEDVINLLGNEFSEKFYDLIHTYLVQAGSYPSFLASITIKLFAEKQENSKKGN